MQIDKEGMKRRTKQFGLRMMRLVNELPNTAKKQMSRLGGLNLLSKETCFRQKQFNLCSTKPSN